MNIILKVPRKEVIKLALSPVIKASLYELYCLFKTPILNERMMDEKNKETEKMSFLGFLKSVFIIKKSVVIITMAVSIPTVKE